MKSRNISKSSATESQRISRRIRGKSPEFHGLPQSYVQKVEGPHHSYGLLGSKMDEEFGISTDLITDEDSMDYTEPLSAHKKKNQSQNSRLFSIESSGCWQLNNIYLIVPGFFLLCVCIFHIFIGMMKNGQEINSLSELFSSQGSSLSNLVEYGKISKSPFVLLLVHDKHDETVTCLAICIAKALVFARLNDAINPLVIDGAEGDYGEQFLINLRSRMAESQALVLLHIDLLHPHSAEKLHYVLDKYSPWIPEGVYILTMEIANPRAEKQLFSAVTKVLIEKWSDQITVDQLHPLITRIADSVILIEKDVDSCPATCDNSTFS